MKLEKASYEIWDEKIPLHDHIERCGRICYASDPIGGEKAVEFCNRLIKSGHLSVLEHGTVYLSMESETEESLKYDENPYSEYYDNDEFELGRACISTNLRTIIENNWSKDLTYLCEPTPYHDKRITVKWNVNRAIANEIVRHRKFSYSQQSTRYCNFSKDRFGNELTFIIPSWIDENVIIKEFGSLNGLSYHKDIDKFQSSECANESNFLQSIAFAEANYLTLLKNGSKPEQARDVLPLALKTELVMTGFAHNWTAFFKLRCDNHAHPDIRQLAIKLRDEFYKKGYIV